jgi:hypothetical protein
MSKKQNRVLSDATIEAILERQDRDEREEPPPEPLIYFKEAPDWDFLITRIQGVLAPEVFRLLSKISAVGAVH